MSIKSIHKGRKFKKILYNSDNLYSFNNSYESPFINQTEISFNNINKSYIQPNISKYNINENLINNNINEDSNNYINKRYNKIKIENAQLKKELFELEKNYKINRGEMEEKLLELRDENSNLQLQIQKTIEKQKNENKKSDTIFKENKVLLDNINILEKDKNNLTDNITKKNADIEEKNKIIYDLLSEKNILLNEDKKLKNKIKNLMKDKEILIRQIQDLNLIIGEKITPKLKLNENNLLNLEEQIENLRINNEKYKNDNILLLNENKVQKNLIKILTKQNKKLLGEIRVIYERDILLMDNMEKIGINNNIQTSINKKNKNNLFDEEMNILDKSQKFINEEDISGDNTYNGELKDIIKYYKTNEENDYIDYIVNFNLKDKNKIKDNIYNNKVKINEINSFNSGKKFKRNKENNKINNLSKEKVKKNLYRNKHLNEIFNDNLPILTTSYSTEKVNKTKVRKDMNRLNIQKSKNYNKINLNDNKLIINTEKKMKIKFRDIYDDIKTNNKLIFSENDKLFNKIRHIYKDDSDSDNYQNLYVNEGKINLKNNNKIKIDKNKNNLYLNEINNKMNIKNNDLDLNDSNLNLKDLKRNNILFNSQGKSVLSDYVEDLNVIQYNENKI